MYKYLIITLVFTLVVADWFDYQRQMERRNENKYGRMVDEDMSMVDQTWGLQQELSRFSEQDLWAKSIYDPEKGYRSWLYSTLSYYPKQEVLNRKRPCQTNQLNQMTDYRYFSHNNGFLNQYCNGFIVGYDPAVDSVVIAFRGTSLNWEFGKNKNIYKNNYRFSQLWNLLNFHMKDWNVCGGGGSCAVDSGFADAYEEVKWAMYQELGDVMKRHPGAKLWVTGHSLGGAMATLAAFDIQGYMGLHIDTFITLESPRVLNPVGANYFMKTVHNPIRITHSADVVPHLPYAYLGWLSGKGDFTHVGTEVYYLNSGNFFKDNYKVCDGSGDDRTCNNQWTTVSAFDHNNLFLDQEC